MIVRSAQFDLAAWCFVFVLYRSGLSRLESITVNPEGPNMPVSLAYRPRRLGLSSKRPKSVQPVLIDGHRPRNPGRIALGRGGW